jgi:hypothetical protein
MHNIKYIKKYYKLEKMIDNECTICYEDTKVLPISTQCCKQIVHMNCLTKQFKKECPFCKRFMEIEITGSPLNLNEYFDPNDYLDQDEYDNHYELNFIDDHYSGHELDLLLANGAFLQEHVINANDSASNNDSAMNNIDNYDIEIDNIEKIIIDNENLNKEKLNETTFEPKSKCNLNKTKFISEGNLSKTKFNELIQKSCQNYLYNNEMDSTMIVKETLKKRRKNTTNKTYKQIQKVFENGIFYNSKNTNFEGDVIFLMKILKRFEETKIVGEELRQCKIILKRVMNHN